MNLLQAMLLARGTVCTQLNDRVFALVSLSHAARRRFEVDYTLTRDELSYYTFDFAVHKEGLREDDAMRFASTLVEQLDGPPSCDFTRSDKVRRSVFYEPISISCLNTKVTNLRIKSPLADARAHFARHNMPRLPLSSSALLGVAKGGQAAVSMDSEQAFCESLARSPPPLLESFTFIVSSPFLDNYFGPKNSIVLTNSRACQDDNVWQIPRVTLGFLVRGRQLNSDDQVVVGLVHLLGEPISSADISKRDWSSRAWPGMARARRIQDEFVDLETLRRDLTIFKSRSQHFYSSLSSWLTWTPLRVWWVWSGLPWNDQ